MSKACLFSDRNRTSGGHLAQAHGEHGDAASIRPLKVLIVEHPAMCLGIRQALDVEVCAETSRADEAIRAAKREQPDVCLIGRHICGERLSVVEGICRAAPQAAVVVLSERHNTDDFLDSIRAGAVGYVVGPLDVSALQRIVRAISSEQAVVPRSMVLELVREVQSTRGGLTVRESQVRGLLRRGYTTAEIARHLGISSVTVRRHISGLVNKLGVEDRSGLTGGSSVFGQVPKPRGVADAIVAAEDQPTARLSSAVG
jgi:DNA-binding NarL/FixJ family response regulator